MKHTIPSLRNIHSLGSLMLSVVLLLASAGSSFAQEAGYSAEQIDPPGAQYFQNRYLGNPAMAGRDSGLHLNGAYRHQLENAPGAPVTQAFSADMYMGSRAGGGVMVFQDNAGLLRRTRVAVSYAYHLPVGEGGALHLGFSLAVLVNRLDATKLQGDAGDPLVNEYNRFNTYFEGDFGAAYTDAHWTIQAAVPNVVGMFKKKAANRADVSSVYSAVAYKFGFPGQFSSLEPEVCLRAVNGYKSIMDGGFRAGFLDDQLHLTGLYHSTGNFTAGIGFMIRSVVGINALYTTQTSGLRTYFDGNYEIDITVNLRKKKK